MKTSAIAYVFSFRRLGRASLFWLLGFAGVFATSVRAQSPVVTASVVDGVAVTGSTNYGVLRIARTGDVSAPLNVRYTWAGTATAWDEFRYLDDTSPNDQIIPAGQSYVDLTFKAVGTREATAGIQIFQLETYTIGSPDTAIFYIYTTDPGKPSITATVIDGIAVTNSSNYAVLRISRTGGPSIPLNVRYYWVGTATAWDEFRYLDGTAPNDQTIPAGQSYIDLTLQAVGTREATGGIQIFPMDAYDIGSPDTAVFNIYTSEPEKPTITASVIDGSAITNSTDYAVLRITRSGDLSPPLDVRYFWVGTATAWDDFRYLDDTAPNDQTIPAGQSYIDLTLKAVGANNGTGGIQIFPMDSYSVGSPDTAIFNIYTGTPTAPTITAQPQNQTVNAGASATFTVAATGSAPLSYQWAKNGTAITSANSDSYVVNNAQTADAGNYTVLVSNSVGSTTSNSATLTVTTGGGSSAPQITTQPQSQTVDVGSTASFSVVATGTAPMVYQWYKGATQLANQSSSTLTIPNVQATDAGSYSATVTNSVGTATSAAATLTVNSQSGSTALQIATQPISQYVRRNDTAVFKVLPRGTAPFSYQWFKDGVALSGRTDAQLSLSNVTDSDEASYSVIVINSSGSAASYPAKLTINPKFLEVHSAAPTVLVATIETTNYEVVGGSHSPDDVTLAGWTVETQNPSHVQSPITHRYTQTWDELAQVDGAVQGASVCPVVTHHRVYLELDAPLQDGQSYTVVGPPPYGSKTLNFNARTTYCESIKVNQVGYSGMGLSRYANFGLFMGDGGTRPLNGPPEFDVVDESTGAVVFSGNAGNLASLDKLEDTNMNALSSGEHVYRLKLDLVPVGGPYYISIPHAGRSRSFGIGNEFSKQIAAVTMRGLFHARCGMALTQPYTLYTHAICHNLVYDTLSTQGQDNVTVHSGDTPMSMAGGYHDAADMDHTPPHPSISIQMLSFYEAFPGRFVDSQYNIPESGNGIPDFVDEILWGIKLWENLQYNDPNDTANYGSVRSGWSTTGYTGYGDQNAANDTVQPNGFPRPPHVYGTLEVTKDTTALCAGIFAQAYRLTRNLPGQGTHAAELLERAKQAWHWLDVQHSINQQEACYMYAALQLYLATGDAQYHSVFKPAISLMVFGQGGLGDRNIYVPGNSSNLCQTAHFISYLVSEPLVAPGVTLDQKDATLVGDLKTRILWFADHGGYAGPMPEDLRYPQGQIGSGVFGLGAGTAQGRYAELWMYASLFVEGGTRQQYVNAVSQFADYALGLNPMGISYYTGLGTDQTNSVEDCNSYYTKYGTSDGVTMLPDGVTLDQHRDANGYPLGNVPGILVYGPRINMEEYTHHQIILDKLAPAWDSLPPLRRYATGWSLTNANEFTVHETTVWNLLMYAFLAQP